MVLVFKTNVESSGGADLLLRQLSRLLSTHQINFDLEDCDRVLRIEYENDVADWVIRWLADWGYLCEELT